MPFQAYIQSGGRTSLAGQELVMEPDFTEVVMVSGTVVFLGSSGGISGAGGGSLAGQGDVTAFTTVERGMTTGTDLLSGRCIVAFRPDGRGFTGVLVAGSRGALVSLTTVVWEPTCAIEHGQALKQPWQFTAEQQG